MSSDTADWSVQLEKLLKKDSPRMPFLSAVIDSAGGDLMGKVNKILKPGGRVVVYGMCVHPRLQPPRSFIHNFLHSGLPRRQ